jgi:hypothetical protein
VVRVEDEDGSRGVGVVGLDADRVALVLPNDVRGVVDLEDDTAGVVKVGEFGGLGLRDAEVVDVAVGEVPGERGTRRQ